MSIFEPDAAKGVLRPRNEVTTCRSRVFVDDEDREAEEGEGPNGCSEMDHRRRVRRQARGLRGWSRRLLCSSFEDPALLLAQGPRCPIMTVYEKL
jgi:hypothetical protein